MDCLLNKLPIENWKSFVPRIPLSFEQIAHRYDVLHLSMTGPIPMHYWEGFMDCVAWIGSKGLLQYCSTFTRLFCW
jgi:hypothetical protein